jgi:glycine/D-amino acid oxidase-like deaminating enzyme
MEPGMAAADETPRAYLSLPEEQVARRRIAVVGGGLMGMATAYAAARLGGPAVSVDLYEANQIRHGTRVRGRGPARIHRKQPEDADRARTAE